MTAALATSLVLGVVPTSSALVSLSSAAAEEDSIEILVTADDPALDQPGVSVEGDVGFGWVLATATSVAADAIGVTEVAPSTDRRAWPNGALELASDPLFGDQWHLENTGQGGGTPDADIDIVDAWAETTGSSDEVIAVIDSGIDLDHPDLVDRLWINVDEIPGNNMDDDGNGYVDDRNGWDMVSPEDPIPQDDLGHGTAVAGAAVASLNGVGVAGVAPNATVMPIRACPDRSCSIADVVRGIDYAVANGATIINLSLGTAGFPPPLPLAAAIDATEQAGILVVAAAGNSGANIDTSPYYPASFPNDNVVAVAATDRNDQPAVFGTGSTNFGDTSVDLAAPGRRIVTTVIGGWGEASGTSFAAPLVAGTAALIRSEAPTLKPEQVKTVIEETVDELPALAGLVATEGRLNAGRAVTSVAENQPPNAVARATPDLGWAPLTVSLDGGASSDPDGSIKAWAWETPGGNTAGESASTSIESVGVHDIELTVTDNLGATSSDVVTVLVGTDFVDTRASIFRLDIAWMSARGITLGCNPPANDRFCPDGNLTRGQLAAFLARALDLPPSTTDHFTDDDDSIFEDDINRLADAGITRGCNPPANDRFCPEDRVNRGQLSAMLRRSSL
ncbi:MAG: S8 family serine peptidase [Acidimicrobiia bacterium]|nr:S8 family serine peptidase [Acidimicrobiia bacterium]